MQHKRTQQTIPIMIQGFHPLATEKVDSLYLSQWFINQKAGLVRVIHRVEQNPASAVSHLASDLKPCHLMTPLA